jgi:hypothetical protein
MLRADTNPPECRQSVGFSRQIAHELSVICSIRVQLLSRSFDECTKIDIDFGGQIGNRRPDSDVLGQFRRIGPIEAIVGGAVNAEIVPAVLQQRKHPNAGEAEPLDV